MVSRELVLRLDVTNASVLVYRMGAEIELVVAERDGGDARIELSVAESEELARALRTATGA